MKLHTDVEETELELAVAQSWRRCASHNVDPAKLSLNPRVSGSNLEARLGAAELVTRFALPVMSVLHRDLTGSGAVVSLADADGYLLTCLVDSETTRPAQRLDLVPGACWHERVKGTNGVGTALAEQQPIAVLAAKHFCQPLHVLNDFGAPIRDPGGHLVAILAAFLPAKAVHKYVMALVTAAARAVERQWLIESIREERLASREQVAALGEALSRGMIAVNRRYSITQINSVGTRLLGLREENFVGSNAAEVLDLSIPIAQASQIAEQSGHADLVIGTGSSRLPAQLRPLQGPRGDVHGYLITFRAREQAGLNGTSTATRGAWRFSFANILGNSHLMQAAVKIAKRAAATSSTVLLLGETGTGKELFAQAIHSASSRASGPFVAVNCGAIPSNLIESELFGHEEGAFTGARRGGRPGKFELANGGTIFLDEIGDMPLQTQVSLLRVLQERQVTRVGGNHSLAIDVRVVAATHKDLLHEARAGRFRLDLYYRLNVITINIPPLRDRGSDALVLADFFLERMRQQFGLAELKLSPAASEKLLNYRWPGNVRELENVLEQAANLADGAELIVPEHLPELSREPRLTALEDDSRPIANLREVEYRTILETLKRCDGSVTRAARALGVARNTLYRKLKELNIGPFELERDGV